VTFVTREHKVIFLLNLYKHKIQGKNMHKRGFFFTLDAIMSLIILAVGMFLFFSAILFVPSAPQTELIAEDTMAFLSTATIGNLNDPVAGIGGTLWQQGKIDKEENTLLQQIGEFYAKSDFQTAEQFIEAVMADSIPQSHFAQIAVESQLLYPLAEPQEQAASKQNTGLLIAKTEVVFGFTNTTTFDLWGPYDVTLRVWQR
jgi:hypothetical protein